MPNRELTRRSFIGETAALSLLGAAGTTLAGEKPYLKLGMMTDTHLDPDPASASRVEGAFRIFKREGVDAIGHCGDLADWHYPEAYAHYRKAFETAYPDAAKRPVCLFAFGNHDALDPACQGNPAKMGQRLMDPKKSFEAMRKLLGFDQEMMELRVVHGVPFVIVPESWGAVGGAQVVEQKIREACQLAKDGVVVLMTHETPVDTAYRSGQEGQRSTALFSKYPQLLTLTGHTHNTLRNELTIWQGAFTAVDVGCLYAWYDCCVGASHPSQQSYTVLVAEFFRGRIVLRRFDVRDGLEYRADSPWTVALPYDPKNAPLSKSNRAKTERKAKFATGAVPSVSAGEPPFDEVTVSFPAASAEEDVLLYRLELSRKRADGAWEKYFHVEQLGEFHLRPQERKGRYTVRLSTGAFDEGRPVRVSVTPVGFFGAEGNSISCVWTMNGSRKGVSVWSCANPMEELPARRHSYPHREEHWLQGTPVKAVDGWLECNGAWQWLVLPGEPFALPKGTRGRLVVEARIRQSPERDGMKMICRGVGSATTVPGDAGLVRYVFDFVSRGESSPVRQLVFCDGRGSVRVERISLEQINKQ